MTLPTSIDKRLGRGDSRVPNHDHPGSSARASRCKGKSEKPHLIPGSMRFGTLSLPRGAPPLRVVLYHHITNRLSSLVDRLGVSTTPAVFEAHIRKMARDYEVVGLDAVLSGNLPRRSLLITFDDGYRSFVETALCRFAAARPSQRVVRHRGMPRPLHPAARQPALVPVRERRPRAAGGGAQSARAPAAHVPAAS